MQIDGVHLMPQTNSTNTAPETSQMLNENSSFQAQLDAATEKINKTSPTIKTMTAEEVAQRNEDIKKASVQLEAIMLKMMYNEMWKTVPKNELFSDGNDNAMEIYRDMYNEELTKAAAEGGGIGLADFIYRQLTETDPHKLY
ncbi:MAG: rod-binding protein [Selenomonadaceae bacterium]|nr:rod-binding protein [Selenomonadaceae bacterium]MBR4382410.1 rod-binding protein [Selenomonadaceae bacterium]